MITVWRKARVLAYIVALGTVAQAATCQLQPAQTSDNAAPLQNVVEVLQSFVQDLAREVLQAVIL